MNLSIKNTGATLARNVRVKFDPPLQSTLSAAEHYPPNQSRMIREGIPSLPPGKEHLILFDRMPDLHESSLPRSYDAIVTFEDSRRRIYEIAYTLDLDVYFGTMQVSVLGTHHAAKALQAIDKTLAKWTQHSNGLRVWNRDEDAFLADQVAEFKKWQQAQRPFEAGEGDNTEPSDGSAEDG